jgi:hypothetical protein
MSRRGYYLGGHTVIGRGSDWFSHSKPESYRKRSTIPASVSRKLVWVDPTEAPNVLTLPTTTPSRSAPRRRLTNDMLAEVFGAPKVPRRKKRRKKAVKLTQEQINEVWQAGVPRRLEEVIRARNRKAQRYKAKQEAQRRLRQEANTTRYD